MANNLRLIQKFIDNFELQPLDFKSSILNNFQIIENNLKAIFAVIKGFKGYLKELSDQTNIDEITAAVYQKIINEKIQLAFGITTTSQITEFVVSGNKKLNITLNKLSSHDIEIFQNQSDVILDFTKMFVQIRQVNDGLLIYPTYQVKMDPINNRQVLAITFNSEINQNYILNMF